MHGGIASHPKQSKASNKQRSSSSIHGPFLVEPSCTANAPTRYSHMCVLRCIANAEFQGHRIRVMNSSGHVSTLAGSAAGFADGYMHYALFNGPVGLSLDANHTHLYVAGACCDNSWQRICSWVLRVLCSREPKQALEYYNGQP